MITLVDAFNPLITGYFVTFFRVAAFVALLPGFGEASVSVRVKLGVALAFTAIVFPLVPLVGVPTLDLQSLMTLLLTETLAGAVLGLGMRMLVLALQTAGTIAAQATSLSQAFGNAGVEPLPAIGHILVVSGLALAMMAGLHIKAAALFVMSYEVFPLGAGIRGAELSPWGIAQVSDAFRLAFSLAIPFLALSMLYNVTLGVINKAMPQLMVAFVGAPAITLGGMFLFFSAAPLMLEVWRDALEAYLSNPLERR